MVKTGTDRKGAAPRPESTKTHLLIAIVSYCMLIGVVFGGTYKVLYGYLPSKYLPRTSVVTGEGAVSISHVFGSIDTVPCESYNVTSVLPRDVYLTSGQAKVDKKSTRNVTRTTDQLYPTMTFNSFYLLEGSSIHLTVCRSSQNGSVVTDLLVFKGDDSWHKWMKRDCNDCIKQNISLPLNAHCHDGHNALLTYEVTERDSYHVVIAGRDAGPETFSLDVIAELYIVQTTFDVSGAEKICAQKSICTVPFRYGSNVDIVLGENHPFQNVQTILASCNFRLSFFLGIFVGLPLSLMFIGSATCIAIFISQKRKKARVERENAKESEQVGVRDNYGLVNNEVPAPTYS